MAIASIRAMTATHDRLGRSIIFTGKGRASVSVSERLARSIETEARLIICQSVTSKSERHTYDQDADDQDGHVYTSQEDLAG